MQDLDASVQWAEQTSQGNGRQLGITGFCWGGGLSGCTLRIIRSSRLGLPGMAVWLGKRLLWLLCTQLILWPSCMPQCWVCTVGPIVAFQQKT